MATEVTRRRPITAELRSMKPGERKVFPTEQYGSLIAVVSRLRRELAREHWNVRVDEKKEQYEYVVTRLR